MWTSKAERAVCQPPEKRSPSAWFQTLARLGWSLLFETGWVKPGETMNSYLEGLETSLLSASVATEPTMVTLRRLSWAYGDTSLQNQPQRWRGWMFR